MILNPGSWINRILAMRWLTIIGVVSYTLYLINVPVISRTVTVLEHAPHFETLVILVSFRFYEVHFLRLGKRWAERLGENAQIEPGSTTP